MSHLPCRVLTGCLLAFVSTSALRAEAPVTFEADVRPILKAHCFRCHGEAGEIQGNLDLRLRRLILAGGDSGPGLVAGTPEDSLLLQRVLDKEMPPENKHPLNEGQIRTIQQWITAGAPTARPEPESISEESLFTEEERNWWAFQPVRRPAVPAVRQPGLVQSPVDAFLLAQLEAVTPAGQAELFRFAPEATREVLIRRVYFDLLGLPPTPEEIQQFVTDDRPDAWPRLVEELLASPRYGERWGRHWLDVAGYADSEGYTEEDQVRAEAFRYRDYVIRAYNENKPFDQFIVEQLAGDELVTPGTGLSPDTVEKLTATGFLRMAPDGTASGGIDQNLARNQVVADTLQIVSTSLLGMTVHCAQCHDHLYDPIPQVDYYRLRAIFEPALDWKHWKPPAARRYSLYTEADRQLRTQIEAEAKAVDEERRTLARRFIAQTMEQELLLVSADQREGLRAAFQTPAAQRTAEQKTLLAAHPSIANISEGALYLYERRKAARINDLKAAQAKREQELLAQAGTGETAKLSPEATGELARYTAAVEELNNTKINEELKKLTDRAADIRAKIPPEEFLRVLTETPGQIAPTFLFYRGDHEQPRQQVKPADLAVLGLETNIPEDAPELPTSGRRLHFARQLTSGQHPLVARVAVNRVWMHHFGRGLVNTPGDFGLLGDRPTHPELLDWLAAEFVASGWDLKQLHRSILVSAAYRQSTGGQPQLTESDPDNRLYGRRSLLRLESESLRDAILAVSGELNQKLYGEPVPVMEDEVGQIVLGKESLDGERKPTKAISLEGEEFRRSVYVQVRRSRTLAALETFDAPAMSPNCDQRSSSNVAPQSLWFMNSQFVVASSQALAGRLQREAPDSLPAQLTRGWQLTLGFTPTATEINRAAEFVTRQQQAFQADPATGSPENAARQALASFCQALISSNRFLYVE